MNQGKEMKEYRFERKNLNPTYISQRAENICPHKSVNTDVHSRIIQINRNVETTQMALQAIQKHIKCDISIQHNMIQLQKAIRYMDESWKKKKKAC